MNRTSNSHRRNASLHTAWVVVGAAMALAACGGAEEDPALGAGGAGLETGTAGAGATETGSGGDGAGSVGAGGAGGEEPSVNVAQLAIGEPLFDVGDIQLFAAPLGTASDEFVERKTTTESVLPDHLFLLDLDLLAPGAASPPPYDHELAAGVLAAGFISRDRYQATEWEAPQGIYLAAVIVPNALSVHGSSSDFESGAIIPNAIFPISVDVDLWKGGAVFDQDFDFEYPTTDVLVPDTQLDGYSHMPLFFWRNTDMISGEPATYQFRMRITDAQGNGWRVFVPLFVE